MCLPAGRRTVSTHSAPQLDGFPPGRPSSRPVVPDLSQTRGVYVELGKEPGPDMDKPDPSDPRVLRTRSRALAAARHLAITEGPDAVTHVRVARDSGVGRRTLYRHWVDNQSLLHDALAEGPVEPPPPTGDVRADLLAYLEALRGGLVRGDLALVLHMLGERSASSELLARLRARLVTERCQPLRTLLADAAAALEGPLFYRVLARGEPVPIDVPIRLVDQFLENLRGGSPAMGTITGRPIGNDNGAAARAAATRSDW